MPNWKSDCDFLNLIVLKESVKLENPLRIVADMERQQARMYLVK